ncbi:zonular occludens toxin domain-containing protein, partial [Vibrio parahaemolyticus]|nr:zonular occludens toxin domain-containing protein [Vibrio parahaemolyticus]
MSFYHPCSNHGSLNASTHSVYEVRFMIYAIAGRPGGGKTYEAVAYHIIPAIKEGRKVIT